jgi:FMN phosphatase YigB (HAD superfamily)
MVIGENALGHALARLGGKRLVFSNAPRHYVEEVLRALGVARWFDAVYTIESTRYRPKPAFNGFRILLRAHNVQAWATNFVAEQHASRRMRSGRRSPAQYRPQKIRALRKAYAPNSSS